MFQIVMDSLERLFIKIEIFTNLAMGNVIGTQPLGRFDMGQRIYTVSLVITIQESKRIVTDQFFDRDGFRLFAFQQIVVIIWQKRFYLLGVFFYCRET